jgi:hypothetical protein
VGKGTHLTLICLFYKNFSAVHSLYLFLHKLNLQRKRRKLKASRLRKITIYQNTAPSVCNFLLFRNIGRKKSESPALTGLNESSNTTCPLSSSILDKKNINTVFLLGAGYHKYQCQLDLYNIRLNDSKVRLFLKIMNVLRLHSKTDCALRMVAPYFNR